MKRATIATEPGTSALSEKRAELHPQCFACSVCHGHGLNLHFDVGPDGIASAVWKPSDAFGSYPDRIHGGVIATLMDSAMVHALFARDVAGVTAELTVRYQQGVTFHEPVHVTGWVESVRRGIFYCRAEVCQHDRLAAHATAKFMRMAASGQP